MALEFPIQAFFPREPSRIMSEPISCIGLSTTHLCDSMIAVLEIHETVGYGKARGMSGET